MGYDKEGLDKVQADLDAGVTGSELDSGVSTRRKFSRGAVGTAVLLTLGSRVAWGDSNYGGPSQTKGKGKTAEMCMSAAVWESYTTGSPSAGPNGDKFSKQAQEFEKYQKFSNQPGVTSAKSADGKTICATKTMKPEPHIFKDNLLP
jgi:hypothetical protein